jgi:hypothetical protein
MCRPVADAPDSLIAVSREQMFARGNMITRTVRMQLVGVSKDAKIEPATQRGQGKLPSRAPSNWRRNLSTYARVQVQGVYPGVNMVYYGNQHQLEYDFILAPGVDPALIRLRFSGADQVSTNQQGELVIVLGGEAIRQPRPLIYQPTPAGRRTVDGGYVQLDSARWVFVSEHDRGRVGY